MRIPTPIQALSAAAALALLAGCSSGSAIAPNMTTPQGHVSNMMGHVPAAVGPMAASRINVQPNHKASFDNCPSTGPLVYSSDFNLSQVYIFVPPMNGSNTPCGVITGFSNPQGLFVKGHDLYVANTGGFDVVGFHRGATTPFVTCNDGLSNYPVDVTIGAGGELITTNIFNSISGPGSISTFLLSGASCTSQHNYPSATGSNDYFLTVLETEGNKVYFDDSSTQVYKVKCDGGVCGTPVGTGAFTQFPGGIQSADEDALGKEDVVVDDQTGATLTTYETFPTGTSCSTGAVDGVSFGLNKGWHDAFIADASSFNVREVKYPTCALVGTSAPIASSLLIGAASDPAGGI